jgi:hypothetical protein
MKKRCIINFAKGTWYPRGQQRLIKSLETQIFKGDMFAFKDEKQIPSLTHQEAPYAFKIAAFEKALARGYESILWCDSALYAIRPLEPIFDYIEEHGHMFFWDGWDCAQWTNDKMLNYFNLSRDQAQKISQILACFIGLDLTNEKTKEFLKQWKESIPYFKGRWTNQNNTESQDPRCMGHRHDQSAASIIATTLGMFDETRYCNKWLQYLSLSNGVINPECIMISEGLA